jgi:hypothetical protein
LAQRRLQPDAEEDKGPEGALVEREDCLEGQPAYPCPTATLPLKKKTFHYWSAMGLTIDAFTVDCR